MRSVFYKTVINKHIYIIFFVLIFPLYIFNVFAHGMSPWKMGGMAMFASVDGPTNRFIQFTMQDGEVERLVYFDFLTNGTDWRHVTVLPKDKYIRNISDDLLRSNLYSTQTPSGDVIISRERKNNQSELFSLEQKPITVKLVSSKEMNNKNVFEVYKRKEWVIPFN